MIDPPTSPVGYSQRERSSSPFRRTMPIADPKGHRSAKGHLSPVGGGGDGGSVSGLSQRSQRSRTRKLALAVNPYQAVLGASATKTSLGDGGNGRLAAPTGNSSTRSSRRMVASPLSYQNHPRQAISEHYRTAANLDGYRTGSKPDSPTNILTSQSRDSCTTYSTWHDERLLKSLNHSNTFQKRLEEQAAEAIRKAEQKTLEKYEKKLTNCLKTVEAIEKRKKNDLRLVELRKNAEMEKIAQEFEYEMFKEEMKSLNEEKEELSRRVSSIREENKELQQKCRNLAGHNKQLRAEIESNQKVQQEVQQHREIVSKMENINNVFVEAHREAVADLQRLEADCKKEAKEKKKIQAWISGLIALMDERCDQKTLLKKIHKIDDQAKAQRDLVVDLRRARQRSSKRSQKSGTTTELRKKVLHMRKQVREQNHILEDRDRLSKALALRRQLREQQQREHDTETETQEDQAEPRDQAAHSEEVGPDYDANKATTAAAKKRLTKRRRDIQEIVNEMRNLDVKDPPKKIFI